MAGLVNGTQWRRETNGWVIGDLLKSGAMNINSPLLYTSASKYNPLTGNWP